MITGRRHKRLATQPLLSKYNFLRLRFTPTLPKPPTSCPPTACYFFLYLSFVRSLTGESTRNEAEPYAPHPPWWARSSGSSGCTGLGRPFRSGWRSCWPPSKCRSSTILSRYVRGIEIFLPPTGKWCNPYPFEVVICRPPT